MSLVVLPSKSKTLALAGLLSVAVIGWGTGCASSKESAGRDTLTEHVGRYDAAPSGAPKPRVGVPPFNVKTGQGFSGGNDLNDLAADQMTTLLDASERFSVIERAQMTKLIDEQNLEGIVTPGEMAKPAQVRGVDYLLLGKVTNLRVKKEDKSRGFGLGQVGGLINVGAADVKKKDIVITTEAGVDIRLVDPTTGEVLLSNFSEYKKTDSAGAFGLDILGASAEADANISIDEDDKGKILRLALDDALRKSIPKLDKFLKSGKVKGGTAAAAAATAAPATPAMP
ncbi:MAG TPA: CsgG/HfaB family protein, partial [Tepidisphaeraceae bacterium]|nr:CsgG/HfaB family protein [Tepidisphaeraceae bacterium]